MIYRIVAVLLMASVSVLSAISCVTSTSKSGERLEPVDKKLVDSQGFISTNIEFTEMPSVNNNYELEFQMFNASFSLNNYLVKSEKIVQYTTKKESYIGATLMGFSLMGLLGILGVYEKANPDEFSSSDSSDTSWYSDYGEDDEDYEEGDECIEACGVIAFEIMKAGATAGAESAGVTEDNCFEMAGYCIGAGALGYGVMAWEDSITDSSSKSEERKEGMVEEKTSELVLVKNIEVLSNRQVDVRCGNARKVFKRSFVTDGVGKARFSICQMMREYFDSCSVLPDSVGIAFNDKICQIDIETAIEAAYDGVVDWSVRKTDQGKPALIPLVNSASYTKDGRLTLDITMENTGDSPAYRVCAMTDSKDKNFGRWYAFFGKIGPGEKISRVIDVKVNYDPTMIESSQKGEGYDIKLSFSEANGHQPVWIIVSAAPGE